MDTAKRTAPMEDHKTDSTKGGPHYGTKEDRNALMTAPKTDRTNEFCHPDTLQTCPVSYQQLTTNMASREHRYCACFLILLQSQFDNQ